MKNQVVNIETLSKETYSEMYVSYYKKLFNYGRKFTEDYGMIEDSIDEVFIFVWVNRKNLRSIKFPKSYIFSSFRNNIFKKIKSLKLTQFPETMQETEVQFSIDSILIQKETAIALKLQLEKGLHQLTERQREAIFLRFYEGLSYLEISRIMDISVKATYKIMARALSGLKDILSVPLILLVVMLKELL